MPDTDDDDAVTEAINGQWRTVKSCWPWNGAALKQPGISKTIASVGNTVASLGVGVAGLATGTSTLAVGTALAAGAAVAGGPLGLAIAAGALTLTSAVTNISSTVSSTKKAIGLRSMMNHEGYYGACTCRCPTGVSSDMSKDHNVIFHKVLPYIVKQKTEKAVRKGLSLVPLVMSVYRVGRAFKANRGAVRGYYANVLARHLVTHDCRLANEIVGVLHSWEEMKILRMFPSDQAEALIKLKMKSI